jgi:hypothetical protein
MPNCPHCGTDNPPQNKHCGQCGAALAEKLPIDEELEELRKGIREIKQLLFSAHIPASDEIQALRIEDMARERVHNWIKGSFIFISLVFSIFIGVLSFMGKTKVDDFINQAKSATETITVIKKDVTDELNKLQNEIKGKGEGLKKEMADLQNDINNLKDLPEEVLNNISGVVTLKREITLIKFYTDLFKHYLLKTTLDSDARMRIERFEIVVADQSILSE